MKNIKLIITTIAIIIAPTVTFAQVVEWKVKEGYSVKLQGKGVDFKGLKATISFDEMHPEKSSIVAAIDATSLKAGSDDITLQAKEKLEVKKYPAITFKSLEIKKTSGGYEATGNLTLKGVTRQIKFPFNFDSQKNSGKFPFVFKETFQGNMTIVPFEFNVSGYKPGEQLVIELTVPVTK